MASNEVSEVQENRSDAVMAFQRDFQQQLQLKMSEAQEDSSELALPPPPNDGADDVSSLPQGDDEGDDVELDKQNPNVPKDIFAKHPLQFKWVLWYCKSERNKQWEDCLKEVTEFSTVEDFWALYNHIQLASGLSWGSDYYLFKKGIQPMWEDASNVNGGRWLVQVDKFHRNEKLDHYWLDLLMSVVGEQYEEFSAQICGAVVNIRQKGDKVSLWTGEANDDAGVQLIGRVMKAKLNLEPNLLTYEAHQDTSHKTSSSVKYRFRI